MQMHSKTYPQFNRERRVIKTYPQLKTKKGEVFK
jgi:hypothetical protein